MNIYTDLHVAQHPAVASASLKTTVAGVLSRLLATLDLWYERHHQRRQLELLDDRLLRDIGLDRASAWHEASKPFWQA